jgi:hypothetical protein
MGVAVALTCLVVGTTGAMAQDSGEYRGTAEQQSACMNDVFRLCWNDIPNVSRIVACLQRDRAQLSAACRSVFNQNSSTRLASLRHRRFASQHHRSARYEHESER